MIKVQKVASQQELSLQSSSYLNWRGSCVLSYVADATSRAENYIF